MALYPMHGPVIVTLGAQDGGVAALDASLAQHAARGGADRTGDTGEWRTRPPASSEAAVSDLFAYAARDVAHSR
ncbi:hypothetical protein GCM10010448_70680 [Streptomyces glomeratus]|uniref:Uncharacterized protein n=1 Tax=Streptomyces glomeratus TaxID=284452 RepID=A0ABP6M756_9ACTN